MLAGSQEAAELGFQEVVGGSRKEAEEEAVVVPSREGEEGVERTTS
jgi:hypothetical protein